MNANLANSRVLSVLSHLRMRTINLILAALEDQDVSAAEVTLICALGFG